jgi:flagellar FliL protein
MAEIPTLAAAPPQPEAKSGKGWLIATVVLALLLLAGACAATWYFTKLTHQQRTETAGKDEAEQQLEPLPKGPPLFVALDPPFVVNFEASQLVRFLQITMEVMSRDPATIDLIKANDPIVRNDLLMLFANQKYEVLATREGKETLRQQALDAVREVVKNAGGKPHFVEAVYFTAFVMQ